MKAQWDSLMKRSRNILNITIDPLMADYIYDSNMVPAYTENRHYHTLNHIKVLLKALQDFDLSPEERVKLEWAVWFHDYVYNSQAYNNEWQSAKAFQEFGVFTKMKNDKIYEISQLITITKHIDKPTSKLGKIICDVDLKQLASDWHFKNAQNVRKEYSFLSDKEWKKGRSEFLETMLAKEHIYHTDEYRGTLEDTARHNLKEELDTLAKQQKS